MLTTFIGSAARRLRSHVGMGGEAETKKWEGLGFYPYSRTKLGGIECRAENPVATSPHQLHDIEPERGATHGEEEHDILLKQLKEVDLRCSLAGKLKRRSYELSGGSKNLLAAENEQLGRCRSCSSVQIAFAGFEHPAVHHGKATRPL